LAAIRPQGLTELLIQWSNGNRDALDELVPLVDSELRRLVRTFLRRRQPHQSLQTDSLINEAFVRLIDQKQIRWVNRAHFFGIAARTMRNILVDHARKRGAAKRGGGAVKVTFDEAIGGIHQQKELDLIALDEALTSLAQVDPSLSQLVELRFFGGLTIEETAEVVGVSTATVERRWKTAKIWLRHELPRS